MSVKNGAELLDRLMKDIVAEAAPSYISIYPSNTNADGHPKYHEPDGMDLHGKLSGLGISASAAEGKDRERGMPSPKLEVETKQREADRSPARSADPPVEEDKRALSLARFIPLLSERVYVISPYTRMHLVSWLMVLDSVPDLELVAWLPDFLDGLL